ncbi:MAG: DUF6893 family small protein [Ktedonobacteraceae bacterium]
MPITGKEALTLLNGFQGGERHDPTQDTINIRRLVILVLVVLGLGIVIPLFSDIKRYLRIRRM